MSDYVHANPTEIRKFVAMLKRFNQDLANNKKILQGQFKQLGETWKDSKHKLYAEQFTQLMKQLDNFILSSEAQIPLLERDADLLEEFLRRR